MLGSRFEAEDAVQETFVRAWRAFDGFEGRSSVRSWLFTIATNVCLDMLRRRSLGDRPVDLSPAATDGMFDDEPGSYEHANRTLVRTPSGAAEDPAEVAITNESIRDALITLRRLPSRQRAALTLRDVLGWSARDAAELLDVSVAALNSALQRARANLRAIRDGGSPTADEPGRAAA
jgi:RNA polymerase sigma-70 factor (ECF subfamily)